MSHKAQRLRNQQSTAVTLHPNSYNLLCALEAKLFKLHSRLETLGILHKRGNISHKQLEVF